MKKLLILTVGLALVLLTAPRLEATEFNLYTSAGLSATINGAVYTQGEIGSGTGIFPSFVRVQANGTEQAYNTTANYLNNTNDNTHNYAIQVKNLTEIVQGGISYYQFNLDINESGGGQEFLSLDRVMIGLSGTGNLAVPITSAQFTWVYDMDASGTDNRVLMDYSLEAGSGKSDMSLLVPKALFGSDPNSYVYLYSQFGLKGGVWDSSDGFEEWAYRTSTTQRVPDGGATAFLLGLSMLGLGAMRRFRR